MTSDPPVATIREPLPAHGVAAAPVEQVLRWLDSSADGLSSAQACERLAHDGPNVIRTHHVSAWVVLVRQLNNAVLILLAITAVLSHFLGDHTQALTIGVILAASIGLRFFNEYRDPVRGIHRLGESPYRWLQGVRRVPDEDDTGRLITGEAQQFDCVSGEDGHHLSLQVIRADTSEVVARQALEQARVPADVTPAGRSAVAKSVEDVANELARHEGLGDEQRTAQMKRWCEEATQQFVNAPLQTFVRSSSNTSFALSAVLPQSV
jgi:hypothetical protein